MSGTYASANDHYGSQSAAALLPRAPRSRRVGWRDYCLKFGRTPKRVSARLELTRRGHVAAIGVSKLRIDPAREPFVWPCRDALDSQLDQRRRSTHRISTGLFQAITPNPSAPAAGVARLRRTLLPLSSGGIDGLWANTVEGRGNRRRGPDTYRLSAQHLPRYRPGSRLG